MSAPTKDYGAFLASKQRAASTTGRPVEPGELHPSLHPFQHDIVSWAVQKGRAAIWTTTGTGKSRMQLEYARLSGATGLIVAPLAVCQQTIREAVALDMEVRYVRDGGQITGPGTWVTNYELVQKFDPRALDVAVLDEGSILRDSTGKTRNLLIDQFKGVPRRLTCTATPAPNEAEELTNQAEFVGAATRVDMLASYFVHDEKSWRVKGHARGPMFRWMASWAVALRRPSDLGYADDGYILPGLDVIPQLVEVEVDSPDQLFATDLGGVGGRARVRRQTLAARCERAAELVAAEPGEPWLLWCALNDEANELARLLPGAVNVHGAMSPEEKAEALLGFADGHIPTLITKPSIAGRGLNWQRCARMAFVGLGDSYEDYFQCIRRCLRYGQTRRVHAHVVLSEIEQQIAANVARKEREADQMMAELVAQMRAARDE
ncbi:MAG: helicase-related protein, partial [Trebonia sp.]